MISKNEVHDVARCMVRTGGLINLSRRELCKRAGIPDGSFPHVMGCNFSEFVDELKLENITEMAHPVSKTRANPTLRKEHILSVALEMSREYNYSKITRDKIAEGAGVSMGLVTRYFGTMKQLRRAIMRQAIAQGLPDVVAQGLAVGDEHAKRASKELRSEATEILISTL